LHSLLLYAAVDVILIMFQSTSLQSLAERNLDIPPHIDICIVRGEAELSDINAVDFIVASAEAKVARLEAYIEGLSVADDVDESALDLAYEELKEMDPSTFEAKAGIILYGLSFTQMMMTKPTKEDGTCASPLPVPFSSNSIFSSSTNPPIIWISEPLSGSKPIYPRIITSWSSLPIRKVSRTRFAPNGKRPRSLLHTCLIHSLGGGHSVELMLEGRFFFNWLVDPFRRLLTPRSRFVTSLAPVPTMNGMFLNSSRSFSDFSVAPMNDIRVLSRNAGTIDQVSARQWIEAALGRAHARTVAGNYIWVLM
jgi:hypothetical protein